MKDIFIYMDSEFSTNKKYCGYVLPICASLISPNINLNKDLWTFSSSKKRMKKRVKKARDYINRFRGATIVCYSQHAEADYLRSIGCDPKDFKWIDLFIEYQQLLNSNHEFEYGKQYINGTVKTIYPPKPKWMRTDQDDEEKAKTGRAARSLLAALYKLCGIIGDSDHKNKMRDICIAANPKNLIKNKKAILNYCNEDTKHLPGLHKQINKNLYKSGAYLSMDELLNFQLSRGEDTRIYHKIAYTGYPVDVEGLLKLKETAPKKMLKMAHDIKKGLGENHHLIQIKNHRNGTQSYSTSKKFLTWYVEKNFDTSKFPRTDKKALSLGDKVLEKLVPEKDKENPKHVLAMYRKIKKAQSDFNIFTPKPNTEHFFDKLCPDGFVRLPQPQFNSQTSRTYPRAKFFLPAKSSWLKAYIKPPKGFKKVVLDYSRQEFLIGAIASGDQNMCEAYASGDAYLYLAKRAGAVPANATEKSHKATRDIFKRLTLAVGYGMGYESLALELGIPVQQAVGLINMHENIYPDFHHYRSQVFKEYKRMGFFRLRDGWTLFGDNPSGLSVTNFPMQGGGAEILRRSLKYIDKTPLASDPNYLQIYTHHDSSAIMVPKKTWKDYAKETQKYMIKGFTDYMNTPCPHGFIADSFGAKIKVGIET